MTNSTDQQIDKIDLDIATLFMKDGIIQIIYKDNVIIDSENVKAVIEKRISMAEGIPRPILVDGRKVFYWTRESKDYSHSEEAIKEMSAVAIINSSFFAKIHMNFIMMFYKPPFPLRVFNTIDAGLIWLEQFKKQG